MKAYGIIARLWETAASGNSESAWHLLPEDVFDRLDESSEEQEFSDAQFLHNAAVSPDVPRQAAVAAIRLIGMLAEEGKLAFAEVLPTLKDLLAHDDPSRRYYAVKAIWQARASDAMPALKRRLSRETSDEILSVLQRSIAVLDPSASHEAKEKASD